jgi:hypothetical protein
MSHCQMIDNHCISNNLIVSSALSFFTFSAENLNKPCELKVATIENIRVFLFLF